MTLEPLLGSTALCEAELALPEVPSGSPGWATKNLYGRFWARIGQHARRNNAMSLSGAYHRLRPAVGFYALSTGGLFAKYRNACAYAPLRWCTEANISALVPCCNHCASSCGRALLQPLRALTPQPKTQVSDFIPAGAVQTKSRGFMPGKCGAHA